MQNGRGGIRAKKGQETNGWGAKEKQIFLCLYQKIVFFLPFQEIHCE
jgi:hypothetical protein